MAIKPIQILINAKDNASGVFSSLQAKIAGVGAAIAGYFGVKAFSGAVASAADFEQAMSRVQAATGGSAAEMAQLNKAAQDAGANTKYTSTEAAGALENLAKAGLSAADAVGTLPAVLNLAQAGDIGLADASEIVTKAIMGMGGAFTDAARYADVLALGANATNSSVTGLGQALSYVAPVAQSAGISLEGTVAILGKLSDAGIDASRSGTSLANILAQFSDPASQFKRALADAGITTNNFEDALKQLAAAGPKGEKAILAVGLNGGPALRALLNQGMGALDELKKKLENSAGSAATFAKVMEDNLGGSFKGLSSAWEALTIKLGTPVLPVLKDAVDQLAGAFRGLIADGTITKFGDAIATAFQAGIKWAREFFGTVDFGALVQRMQAFADSAKQRFDEFGRYATNAGNIVQTAYGVMGAGVNAVLAGIYGIGSVFSDMVGIIATGTAKLNESFAAITFGDLSERFKASAAEATSAAQAYGEAAQAMRDKASAAFIGVADSAETARGGFAGLTGAVTQTGQAASAAAPALDDMGKRLEDTRLKTVATQKATTDKAAADAAARVAIAALRDEYAALIAKGDLQAAALKITEINKALAGTAPAAKDAAKAAADAALAIERAFQVLGVTSTESLKNSAAEAKAAYETIKNAGTSSAQDIGAAFKVAAVKAIAANNGIAPSWVEAQAAARGYKVEVDASGKATVAAMGEAKQAVGSVGAAVVDVSAALRQMGIDAATASEEVKALAAAGQMLAAAEQARTDARNAGIEKDKYMNRAGASPVDAVPTFNSKAEGEAWMDAWKKQYARDNPFTTKQKRQLGRYGYDLTMFEYDQEMKALELRDAMKTANGGTNLTNTTRTPAQGTVTKTVNINVNGVRTSINTDNAGEDAINSLIRQLGASRGTSAIR